MRRIALLTAAIVAGLAASALPDTAEAGGVRYYHAPGPQVQAMPMHQPAPVSARAGNACWQTYNPLYGAYKVAFCVGLHGQGTYRVIGGGYDCKGHADWRDQGDILVYQMRRGTCGAQADWTPDQIVCRSAGGFKKGLTCTYAPAVTGHAQARFSAFRQ